MNEAPRPSTLGEILDRTVNFYRARFLVFFGIPALPTGAILVLASGIFFFLLRLAAQGNSPSQVMEGVVTVIVLAMLLLFAVPALLAGTALAEAALTYAANAAYYDEKISIRGAYRAIWRRGWHYVGLYFLRSIAIWAVPFIAWFALSVVFAGLSVAAASMGFGSGVLVVLIGAVVISALVAYCVWMALQFSLGFPACVVEQISPWAAMKRSFALCKGTRLRVFLLYVLGTVLTWILSGGLAILVIVVTSLMPGARDPQRAQQMTMISMFVYYGAGFAVQALTKPVYGVALLLFYYDQRIRHEGFDIEWMMARAGLVPPAPVAPEAQPETQPWMTAGGGMASEPAQEETAGPSQSMPGALADADAGRVAAASAAPSRPAPADGLPVSEIREEPI